jgi:LAO/AO transport system kinase
VSVDLAEGALAGEKRAIAKLVSLFEDRRVERAAERRAVLEAIDAASSAREGAILGITGTPGAGKSTLTSELVRHVRALEPALRVAIVAIDPSSHVSGGALLGDRTRMRLPPGDERVYFRSQASDTALGGLSPNTFQVCRLLYRLFDVIFVETVGIGQSEIDIRHLADRVYLVMQPLGGDEVQFLKAGIMEVPDEIVLNKCDEAEAAAKSYRALRSTLSLARPFDADSIPIHRVSARTGMNVERLAARMLEHARTDRQASLREREVHHLARWAEDEWGRVGLSALSAMGGPARLIGEAGDFDGAQALFDRRLRERLAASSAS